MKELFCSISNVSKFFTERRFVFDGKDGAELADSQSNIEEKPVKKMSDKEIMEASAKIEGGRLCKRDNKGCMALLNRENAIIKRAKKIMESGEKGEERKDREWIELMGTKPNDKFNKLRKKLIDNPASFKGFEKYSKLATKTLAEMGNKIKKANDTFKGDAGNRATIQSDNRVEVSERQQEAIPLIEKAFNKDQDSIDLFFSAMVDLHIHTDLSKNKSQVDKIYRLLAEQLAKKSPEAMALLPDLQVKPTMVAEKGKKQAPAKPTAVAGVPLREPSRRSPGSVIIE